MVTLRNEPDAPPYSGTKRRGRSGWFLLLVLAVVIVAGIQPDPAEAVAVARGSRTDETRLVADPDQVTHVEHAQPAPIARQTKEHTPESEEEGTRTPAAPFQDAKVAPSSASAWEASPSGAKT